MQAINVDKTAVTVEIELAVLVMVKSEKHSYKGRTHWRASGWDDMSNIGRSTAAMPAKVIRSFDLALY